MPCNPNPAQARDAHLLAIRPASVKNGVGPTPPLASNAWGLGPQKSSLNGEIRVSAPAQG